MISFRKFLEEMAAGNIISAVLSSPLVKEAGKSEIQKIVVRPIEIKGAILYQLTDHYAKKVVHRNLTKAAFLHLLSEMFSGGNAPFRQGNFYLQEADYHLIINKKQQMTLMKKRPTLENKASAHNRKKNYLLEEGSPVPFLCRLGVMSSDGKVISKKYDKFRQINRFLEMVKDILPALSKEHTLKIVDFGCGKAYLTFALYHYLKNIEQFDVHMIGLDLKKEVIEECQQLAHELGYVDLFFRIGDIKHYQAETKVDLMIALHACDTATDAALQKAIQWEADVILCVPCCQHELFNQIENEQLHSLLRYGILKERFAALATDAARADLLTMHNYEVQILEFIDMEHTPKNLLIRAVKKGTEEGAAAARKRYEALKTSLQIQPSLEVFLEK